MKILNTFTSSPGKPAYYEVSRELYRNGDYVAYQAPVSVVLAYNGAAIQETVGLNKVIVDALANNERPTAPQHAWLYDRALEIKGRIPKST